jgi:endoglucanase
MKLSLFAGLALATVGTLCAETHFLDIKTQANTALEDDGIANNGEGGWTDEGINDMLIFPRIEFGQVERNGYRFEIIDPGKNDGRSVILLRGVERCTTKPESVEVSVGGKLAPYVYFLQNAAAAPKKAEKNYLVATYEVFYKDGTSETIPVRDDLEIHQWFTGAWWDNSGAASWPFYMGTNVYSVKWKKLIGVWAMQWKNPFPDKPIEKIVLRSAGAAVPAIFAITLSDEDFRADEAKVKAHFGRPDAPPQGFFDAKLKLERSRIFEAAEKAGHFQGIRSVVAIRPDLLAVTVDGSIAESGPGLNNEAMTSLQKPESFSVQCGGKPLLSEKVGRQSFELWKGNVSGFPEVVLYSHTFYLKLPEPLKPGQTCTVSVPAIPERFKHKEEFTYSPEKTITPAIKVNQVAYSALADERYAYLGWWAGDLGTVNFSDMKKFEVVDEATGKSVLTGDLLPRAEADVTSGESVSEMKLNDLPPGKYHILIPGFARSDTFGIGLANGIKDLYYHTMRAFFHQRAGVELKPEFTDFPRPAAHRATYESGYGVENPNYVPKPGEVSREFFGGYYDAGDDDTFTTHLRATAQALLIYEAFPKAFKDKDLNLPESGNKIPDVLDEAAWALSFYQNNQRPDGAIYYGQGNDQDYIRGLEVKDGKRPAFGLLDPRNNSASEYAAVAAQLARLVRPFDAAQAEKLTTSAEAAYVWAKANPDPNLKPEEDLRNGNKLLLAFAASELFNTTGKTNYHEDFLALGKEGAFTKTHWTLAWLPSLVRWSYVSSKQPGIDQQLRDELIKSIKRDADGTSVGTRAAAYRNGSRVGAANGWGTFNGGGHQAFNSILAYLLTKDVKYLTTASLNADFQLGANPLSKGFITGLGARHPVQPQLNPKLYSGPEKTGKTAPGITVYGLSGQTKEGFVNNANWYPSKTPPGRHWVDQGSGSESSSEFTITETIGSSAMLYEFLYALESTKGEKN